MLRLTLVTVTDLNGNLDGFEGFALLREMVAT
jgi:hypothetical protein